EQRTRRRTCRWRRGDFPEYNVLRAAAAGEMGRSMTNLATRIRKFTLALLICPLLPGCASRDSTARDKKESQMSNTAANQITVKFVKHTNPFNFKGVDTISIAGRRIEEMQTPIPFSEKGVEILHLAVD